jgi:hypothetical protein
MTKRNLILTSAVAALVSAGFVGNSVSAFAHESGDGEHAAKHGCKGKKGKHCDCKKKNCTGKGCAAKEGCDAKKAKASCEGKKAKEGCDAKEGCHAKPDAAEAPATPTEAK